MSIYALIEHQRVKQLFETDGDITQMFHPSFIWVNVDGVEGIAEGWAATQTDTGWSFATYVAPPPTDAEIIAANTVKLQQANRLAVAQRAALTDRINTINGGIDIGEALPEEVAELPIRQAQLVEWNRYALYLGRVTKQAGWALTVTWPVQPAEGMDLTVSAAAPETA